MASTIKAKDFKFLKFIYMLLIIHVFQSDAIIAQDEQLNVFRQSVRRPNRWLYFTDAENSLGHYIAGQAYDLLDKRSHEIAGLTTLADWKERQKLIRESLLEIVGPFPEKTPLNPKILRTVKKERYRIEHIVYESQPGFYVTSSVFIPDGIGKKNKAPAVIYCSGHAVEGYRSTTYLHIIVNLVKKGFIVFAFDPVGQGERVQYFDPETGKSVIGSNEHSYSGAQAFITGSSQAKYMIWDGIRAVDYLLMREEVDHSRIGITGRSGGGTQSAYIAAMDDRIYAAAPEAYITNYTRLLQSIGPQDAEQNLYHGILRGIDHPDYIIARAPKPSLIIATTEDFFNIHGFRETAEEVSRIYKAYGKKDNFGNIEDDGIHASTKNNREAMYAFFRKHLNNPGCTDDQEIEPLSPEDVRVTVTGQLSTSLGGETIFSLNRKETEKRIKELEVSRNNPDKHISRVLNSAKKLSGYQEPTVSKDPVFTGRIIKDDYIIEKYFFEGEGDYYIPYLLMIPDKSNNKAMIYLHPMGKSAEASEGGEIEWFLKKGFTVLAPDMIGTGELSSENSFPLRNNIWTAGNSVWYSSILIGRSIIGIWTSDVISLTDLLKKHTGLDEIYGFARKDMSALLLYAAAFNPSISRIALVEPYISYRSIVMNRFYDRTFIHTTVPSALKVYDLPDLGASLAPRRLLIAGITDGNGQHYDSEGIEKDISIIRTAFKIKKAEDQLNIKTGELTEKPFHLYMEWIK